MIFPIQNRINLPDPSSDVLQVCLIDIVKLNLIVKFIGSINTTFY